MLLGYKDLCERVDRNLHGDHKRSLEKLANVKRSKLAGVYLSDQTALERLNRRIEVTVDLCPIDAISGQNPLNRTTRRSSPTSR